MKQAFLLILGAAAFAFSAPAAAKPNHGPKGHKGQKVKVVHN